MSRPILFTVTLSVMSVVQTSPAMAYVGPGAGLSAIGSVLAFFGVILLMIVGFFWYPLKRMFRRSSQPPAVDAGQADTE